MKVSVNFRLPMPIRVAAERHLLDRLPKLELGERITLARVAPSGVVSVLVTQNNERVIEALMTNPRLRESEVHGLTENKKASPGVLRVVAESPRWASRPAVRLALVQNGRTPVHTALRLLSPMPRDTLLRWLARYEFPTVIRLGAERILNKKSCSRP